MKQLEIVIWLAIGLVFVRGLFVFDMGYSAANTFPVASGLCIGGSVIAAAIMFRKNTG